MPMTTYAQREIANVITDDRVDGRTVIRFVAAWRCMLAAPMVSR
jgi:hypothetical protein